MPLPIVVSRMLDLLALAYCAMLAASMTRLAFTLHTWPFRLFAAAAAILVAGLFVQIAWSLKRNGLDRHRRSTKSLP